MHTKSTSTPIPAAAAVQRPKHGTLQDLAAQRDRAELRLAACEHQVRQWRHLSQQLHRIAEGGMHESETVEAAQQLLDEVDPEFVSVAAECVAAQILLTAAERALQDAQEA